MPDLTPSARAALAVRGRMPHVSAETAGMVGRAAVSAAVGDVETLMRVLHANDLSTGRAGLSFEEMDPDTLDWYRDNAEAIATHLVGTVESSAGLRASEKRLPPVESQL